MESIGGYRIIRRLASGTRAEVLLGHAGHGPAGEPQLAAIKVFRSPVSDASIDAEISALSRLNHPHIVPLLDLATSGENVPILILQRLEPGGLGRLLADRGTLEAGEAVTILAPLISAVMAMHRAGVTHGRLSASAVLFDETGAPMLCGFGAAGSVTGSGSGGLAPAALDQDAGVLADVDGLTALAALVLGRVPDAGAGELRHWLEEQRPGTELLARLEGRLFALAEPAPVGLGPDAHTESGSESRTSSIPHRLEGRDLGPSAGQAGRPQPRSGRIALPPTLAQWLSGVPDKTPEWAASRLQRLPAALRSIRRRVWVVASAGLAAMVAAVILLQASANEPSRNEPPVTAVAPVESPVPSVLAGDDPVAATVALLELRTRCLLERSLLCLETVHQAGSAAWQADAALIGDVQDGAEQAQDIFRVDGGVTLIDRMGNTALVGLRSAEEPAGNATASVLMIKTEAGWRVRGLLAGPTPLAG